MQTAASMASTSAQVRDSGAKALSVEQEELYTQLLALCDRVVQGQHPQLKLPPSAIEKLKASLAETAPLSYNDNVSAFAANRQQASHLSPVSGLQPSTVGLVNGNRSRYPAGSGSNVPGLNPIFLEKSDSLVRAEGQLKRQRLERDLQSHVDQVRHSSRDKDTGADAPSGFDIAGTLSTALARVPQISALQPAVLQGSGASSVFDETDYYSSLVQSDWSSDASSSKGSDKAIGASKAHVERRGNAVPTLQPPVELRETGSMGLGGSHHGHGNVYDMEQEEDEEYEPDDEDDEYAPPDAAAIDSSRPPRGAGWQGTSADDDDNSDYEPGEITPDSNYATPQNNSGQQTMHQSPQVPVIRNQLTHIVAPQPNRVSPLAIAKSSNVELELINGRPEVVQKPSNQRAQFHSRASTASPSGNGGPANPKKKRKKRKRESEISARTKKRRDRQAAGRSPVQRGLGVKNEPLTPPPPFAPEPPQYLDESRYRPVDLANPGSQHGHGYQQFATSLEDGRVLHPSDLRERTAADHRVGRRDTQDLRRTASLHHAQRPLSPQQRAVYSPVGPYRTGTVVYEDSRLPQTSLHAASAVIPRYETRDPAAPESLRYPEYRDPYAQRDPVQAQMAPPRRIVVDQYGNRYYASEQAPAPAALLQPFSAGSERRAPSHQGHERVPSRTTYSLAPPLVSRYEGGNDAMPPPSGRRPPGYDALDPREAGQYPPRAYSTRPVEPMRYATSPVYAEQPLYQLMQAPPVDRANDATSPLYQNPDGSYSVRPGESLPVANSYLRQSSVAPVGYARQDAAPPPAAAPMRAVSVMPGAEYGAVGQQSRSFSQAPQGMRFVDQHGNEVFPSQVRQVYQ